MAEIPEGTSGTKEVKHAKIKGEEETGKQLLKGQTVGPRLKHYSELFDIYSSSSSVNPSLEGKPLSARMAKEQEEVMYKSFVKQGRNMSEKIDELSSMVRTEILPDQLHSLMEKLIKEQKQLVNLQQEMAKSVIQRATDTQLDPHALEELSEMDLLLNNIHLVSLKLNLQRSVHEAQVKTDTKVLKLQYHETMRSGHFKFTLQEALANLEAAVEQLLEDTLFHGYHFDLNPMRRYGDTMGYMTEHVYYSQQMLVDDLQVLVPQTTLVEEPVYQEQYMKNLDVLIETQEQLVQNLTDLQKKKKGIKLEESSKQDDLPSGEIGKQQLDELELIRELIRELTELIRSCIHNVRSRRYWPGYHFGHYIYMAVCSVITVNNIHARILPGVIDSVHFMHRRLDHLLDEYMMMDPTGVHVIEYGGLEHIWFNERQIMMCQRRFLDRVELWKKQKGKPLSARMATEQEEDTYKPQRQSSDAQSESGRFKAFLEGKPLIGRMAKELEEDILKEPEQEVLQRRMAEISVLDEEEEGKPLSARMAEEQEKDMHKFPEDEAQSTSSIYSRQDTGTHKTGKQSIELHESAEGASVSDVIDKSNGGDSSTRAEGLTSTTQTTQAVYPSDTTMTTTRKDEQALKETPIPPEEVLKEFNKKTEGIIDMEKTDILLQLPYMAVGYFNNKGGILALEKYGVHLYIPSGAIARSQPQQVYIYINPDEKVNDNINDEEEQLSPEIHCGPPGLTFEDSVVLSFPHHAVASDWELTAKMSSASSPAWQALNSSTDGQLVSAEGNQAILLVSHFTGFSLFGRTLGNSCKRVSVGAFGDIFCPRCYAFRVYVWKDNEVFKKRVLELESRKKSEILDTFRVLMFFKGKGHMHVEMTETIEGWNVRPNTTQEIHENDVWSFSQNSVSFQLSSDIPSNTNDTPNLTISCYQQQDSDWQGRKIQLSFKPNLTPMINNNINQTCDAPRPCDAQNQTGAILDAISRTPCPEFSTYGGLSDQKVKKLCEFLDNQPADDSRLGLLDYLSGTGYISPEIAKKDVLKTYFGQCSRHHIPDQEAVQYLKSVLRELNYTGAVEILEPDGQRADAEAKPIQPFLDNESSLMEIDVQICFRQLAKKLGSEWEELATNLRFSYDELLAVKRNNELNVSHQIFCMLVKWQQGFGPFGKDAFNTLSSNLENVERKDLADLLKGRVTSMVFFKDKTTEYSK